LAKRVFPNESPRRAAGCRKVSRKEV